MISTLLLSVEFWLVLGLFLIILDMMVGLAFFAISFGLGALLTSGLLFLSKVLSVNIPFLFPSSWQQSVLLFGVASLLLLYPLRRWMYYGFKDKSDQPDDINKY